MTRMLLLFVTIAIGGIGAVIYLYAMDTPVVRVETPVTDTTVTSITDNTVVATASAIDDAVPAAQPQKVTSEIETNTPPMTAKQISHWIKQTTDEDPAVRAAAIDALASAPKSKAVPALMRTMQNGSEGDRQLAMDSLHTLALEQGDADDKIRTALRLVIYDGNDEVMINSAQIALEDIEYDPAATAPESKP